MTDWQIVGMYLAAIIVGGIVNGVIAIVGLIIERARR